ncbi:hypothetical protein [Nocardia arizonensis]|uniref:hypothetical protein n=1 Tax=Nocardia arizonensis TaxID=1141647 RepID=UPI0006D297A2|nr:hypothetical protein [Nocardia arizonensis]
MSGSVLGRLHGTRATDGAVSGPLLSPRELIAAIAGHIEGLSPMVAWARELGDLHASLLPGDPDRRPEGFDPADVHTETARIIAKIDTWAAAHLPRIPHARLHSHTLGQVVSHVAETFATAWWTVRHSDDEEVRHHAWTRLGEIRESYAALVADLEAKRVRLPAAPQSDAPVSVSAPVSR